MARTIQGTAFLAAVPGSEAFVATCESYMFNEVFPSFEQSYACASVGLHGNFPPSRGTAPVDTSRLLRPGERTGMACGCGPKSGNGGMIRVDSLSDEQAVFLALAPSPSQIQVLPVAGVVQPVQESRFCWLCLLIAILIIAEFGVGSS